MSTMWQRALPVMVTRTRLLFASSFRSFLGETSLNFGSFPYTSFHPKKRELEQNYFPLLVSDEDAFDKSELTRLAAIHKCVAPRR